VEKNQDIYMVMELEERSFSIGD
jgi:hypothetical protein